jgi:hypothetical protein
MTHRRVRLQGEAPSARAPRGRAQAACLAERAQLRRKAAAARPRTRRRAPCQHAPSAPPPPLTLRQPARPALQPVCRQRQRRPRQSCGAPRETASEQALQPLAQPPPQPDRARARTPAAHRRDARRQLLVAATQARQRAKQAPAPAARLWQQPPRQAAARPRRAWSSGSPCVAAGTGGAHSAGGQRLSVASCCCALRGTRCTRLT